jgi:hypothetical protein
MSGFPWTPADGGEPQAVIRQMEAVSFQVEGMHRSYWDFYFGFGLLVGAFLAAQSASLWCLAGIARREAPLVVPVVAAATGGVVVNAYLSYRYFFALPALLAVVIALLLVLSLWTAQTAERRAG